MQLPRIPPCYARVDAARWGIAGARLGRTMAVYISEPLTRTPIPHRHSFLHTSPRTHASLRPRRRARERLLFRLRAVLYPLPPGPEQDSGFYC